MHLYGGFANNGKNLKNKKDENKIMGGVHRCLCGIYFVHNFNGMEFRYV